MELSIAGFDASGCDEVESMRSRLAHLEQDRYELLPESKRRDFLAGRIALKTAFARYASVDAGRVTVLNSDTGIPYIKGHESLHCSISHSRGLGIGAVAPFRVGVDLETVRPRSPSLLRYLASEREIALMKDFLKNERQVVTALWVVKEAVLKALGVGLALSPRRVHVVWGAVPGTFIATTEDAPLVPWYVCLSSIEDLFIGIAYEYPAQERPAVYWHNESFLSVARDTQDATAA